ncbi:MAG: integrase [Eubacteriales bacterium]|nr:integrase [Eubacteriales bacterium]
MNDNPYVNGTEVAEEHPALEDTAFSFAGYQVVRGEFFAHIGEPSITFFGNKVYANTACIKKIPGYDYIQILVNPEEKKLAVKPCKEELKDSFRWTTANSKPKQITCKIFFAKVFTLMNWNPGYRYKLLGKLVRSGDDYLFVFDLTEPEIFTHVKLENGKIKRSRTAIYPEEWKNQFGVPVEEHENTVQVSLFDRLTVFGIQKKPEGTGAEKEVVNYE